MDPLGLIKRSDGQDSAGAECRAAAGPAKAFGEFGRWALAPRVFNGQSAEKARDVFFFSGGLVNYKKWPVYFLLRKTCEWMCFVHEIPRVNGVSIKTTR